MRKILCQDTVKFCLAQDLSRAGAARLFRPIKDECQFRTNIFWAEMALLSLTLIGIGYVLYLALKVGLHMTKKFNLSSKIP